MTSLLFSVSLFLSLPLLRPPLSAAAAATTYFEVTKPIPLPNTKPCSYVALKHDFASTYGKPPVLANYTPPSDCSPPSDSNNFSKIILELTATSKGKQFDRIFGVWLDGVELLRSCTAEPRPTGIIWSVKKDVTRYHSLLNNKQKQQTLAVSLRNIIDSNNTGLYHITLTFHFYPPDQNSNHDNDPFGSGADMILPVSRDLPVNDGLWFEIQNSTHVEAKEIQIPQNAYRAVLEVYVSFHESDEFWYSNFPNDYITANNLSADDYPGNGPFREVIVKLDGFLVGAIWPFTLIYTGGVNPLLWRPITGIGSFDLPTYDIEITPFLGLILDGKKHEFTFSVTDALNVWYIDANLHLWLDDESKKTQGKLLKHEVSPLSSFQVSRYSGLNGSFAMNCSRLILASGWVNSSFGQIETRSRQEFKYSNVMVLAHNLSSQKLDQTTEFEGSVDFKKQSCSVGSIKLFREFRIVMADESVERRNGTLDKTNVTLSFNENSRKSLGSVSSTSELKNRQDGDGYLLLDKSNHIVDGSGNMQQEYQFWSDNLCYSRNVRSKNYTILQDNVSISCEHH